MSPISEHNPRCGVCTTYSNRLTSVLSPADRPGRQPEGLVLLRWRLARAGKYSALDGCVEQTPASERRSAASPQHSVSTVSRLHRYYSYVAKRKCISVPLYPITIILGGIHHACFRQRLNITSMSIFPSGHPKKKV